MLGITAEMNGAVNLQGEVLRGGEERGYELTRRGEREPFVSTCDLGR